jgi:hypothetical protein
MFFPALQQDASIPSQQIVTGGGASSFGFIDDGAALLVFQGAGASALGLADAGAGLETVVGSGSSVITLVDDGVGLIDVPIIGAGASALAFSDGGFGSTVGEVVGGGGGGFSFDWDRAFAPKKKQRNKRKPAAERSRIPPEIFSYASESALLFAGSGSGSMSTLAAGSSRVNLRGSGAGRMEESATEILGLLLMSDEL